ncbi:MAG: hypothetical protein KAJ07_07255 [Planctomycetes bacterium]|nr:hypothetical protein [Planctomycetota bacterium]
MRTKYDLFLKNKFTSRTRALCICLLLLNFTTAFAAGDADHSVFRNRLYKLKHISAEDAGRFLVDMNIGNQVKIMSNNSMMVSSDDPADLTRASSILELIDSRYPYTMEVLADSPDFETMPSIEEIEAKLVYLSIGTFRNPPSDKAKKLAIIDMHGTKLVAIAPPEYIQNIKEIISPPKGDKDMLDEFEEEVDEKLRKVTAKKPKTELIYEDDKSEKDKASTDKASVSHKVDLKRDTEKSEKLDFPFSTTEPLDMPQGEKELELTLTLPEKVEVIALLELVGKQLGLNYIYDAKEIKGDVMLKVHDGKIKVKDTYALLESVLRFRGFVMTRRGNLVTIVPIAKALSFDPTLRKTGDEIQPGDVIVTTVFKLDNISTQTAQNLLQGMKLGMTFNPIAETKTLIVTGYAYRMERIEQILKMVDVAGKPLNIRYRQLKYTVADDLAPKVQTLAGKLGTVSISIAAPVAAPVKKPTSRRTPVRPPTPKAKAPAPGETGVYLETDTRTNRILMIGKKADLDIIDGLIDILDIEKQDRRTIKEYEIQYVDPIEVLETLKEVGVISTVPSSGSRSRTPSRTTRTTTTKTSTATTTDDTDPLTDEPQISILGATNSLLINATAEQHEKIAMIISHVDRQLDRASTPYVVYSLENQDPEKLEEILTQLIEKTKKEARSKDPKAQTKTTASAAPGLFEEDMYVIADPATYSLIVYADKKNQQWISDIIEELDQYRPQVLLDVTLVEISKDNEFNLDLDIVSKYPNFRPGTQMDFLGSLLGSPGSTTFFPSKQITEGRSASGSGSVFFADNHIQALLELMDEKKYGRILARPSLLVRDNEDGEIKTEKTIYVGEEKTSTLTSEGGFSENTDITFKDYQSGITLTITPHIASKSLLQLDIELDRTDFDPADTGQVTIGGKTVPKPLDKVSSLITTTAILPDGATIILGGIETITQTKGVTKIPLLGDIPIIGALFRGIDESDEQSKLYVFVKANIILPGDELTGKSDIEKISMKKRRNFEEAEARFQALQEFPGIEQKPLDPIKILEDDDYLKELNHE